MTYSLPVRIVRRAESFVIEDARRVVLAYVYFEDEPGRRNATGRLTQEQAIEVARRIARGLSVVD